MRNGTHVQCSQRRPCFYGNPERTNSFSLTAFFCSFSHRSRTEPRTQSHALINTGARRVFQPSHNDLLHSARRAGLQTRRRARQVRPAIDVQSAALLVGGNSWRSRGEMCGSLRQEHAALPSGSQRVWLSKSRRAPQRSGKVRGSEGQSHVTRWRRAEYRGGRLSERSHCGKKVSALNLTPVFFFSPPPPSTVYLDCLCLKSTVFTCSSLLASKTKRTIADCFVFTKAYFVK